MNGLSSVNPIYRNQQSYYLPQNNNTVRMQAQEDNTAKTVVTAGILQLLALSLQKVSGWCSSKLMQGKEFTSSENVKKVAEQMVKGNKINVDVKYINDTNIKNFEPQLQDMLRPVARGENAFYADSLKLAVAPESKPSLILHELGHAVNANKGKLLKFLQKSRVWAASIPTALIMLNDYLKPNKQTDDKTFIEKHAGKIGFAAFLPTIIEEGLASIRGAKAAKKVLGNTVSLKPLKRNYFFAWMTYLIAGLGLGISAKQAVIESKR